MCLNFGDSNQIHIHIIKIMVPHEFLGKNLQPIKVSTQLSPASKVRSRYALCLLFTGQSLKVTGISRKKSCMCSVFKQLIRPCFYGQFKLEYETDFISSIITTVTLKNLSELKVEAALRRKVPF